jgi:hypothetical protein
MGFMTYENRFDEFIAREARELDPPPSAPRDAMWAAIVAARSEEQAEPVATVIPIGTARSANRYATFMKFAAPLAAVLVIGIGLGRMMARRESGDARVAQQMQPAVTDSNATSAPGDSNTTGIPSDDPSLAALNRPPITGITPDRGTTGLARAVKRPSNRNAAAGTVIRGNDHGTPAEPSFDSALPYRVAATRHLGRVQTLLVTLPFDVRDGRINEVAARAADLLVNTRLLLDSPAANEPEVHRLLDDLELVLAQAATISPTHSAEDVEMIQKAINQRDVLIRLHTATAGKRLAGT